MQLSNRNRAKNNTFLGRLQHRLRRRKLSLNRLRVSSSIRSMNLETLEKRELMAVNLFNDEFQLTNANQLYSPEIALNVLANDNNGSVNQLVSAANIDYSASNKGANTATYFHPVRTGTSTLQRSMIVGGVTFRSTSNFGDIDLGFDSDDQNNGFASVVTHDRTQGMILGTSRENILPNNVGNTATNLQVLNYNNNFFSSVAGPANDGEIMVRPGLARFPYSQGWIGGSYTGTGAAAFGNSAFTVTKTGTGQYDVAVNGVSDSRRDGFLFAIAEGNSDNYSRAVPLGGNSYRVVVRDNAATFSGGEDGAFNLLYIPRSTQGLVGGHVRGDTTIANPMIQSFGNFSIQRTGDGNWTMSVPGHTPETGILVIESADFDRTRGANVYFSYQPDPTGANFLIRQMQFEGTQTNLLNDDFVVFFIPFENQLAPTSPLSILQLGTAGNLNSGLSANGVALTINADGTVNYAYPFESLRALAQGTVVQDTFVYTATDGVDSTSATVTVTLRGSNDRPTLLGAIPAISLVEDGSPTTINLSDYIIDYDAGDVLSYSVSLNAGAPVAISVAGSTATVTPLADQYGAFSFSITATDPFGASVSTTVVTGNVQGVLEGVKAVTDTAQTTKDAAVDISVLANDYDPENSQFSVAAASVNSNVDATTDAATLWSIIQSTTSPNNLSIGTVANLGDVDLRRNGSALQQSLGVMLGTPTDNTTPYATVNSYGNILNGEDTGYWFSTERGAGGNGERNTPLSAAFFPFADGWTSGHIDTNGILRSARGVTQADVTLVTAGLFEIAIPEASDSTTSGYLFATTSSNDDNILSIRPIAGTNKWQIRNNDNDSLTGFEADGISFVYIPATTPNLIAGRWNSEDGSLVQVHGGLSATASVDGAVTVSIPGHSPSSGVLLAIATGIASDTVNGVAATVPSNNAAMYTAVGSDFSVLLRTANTFTQVPGDVQFIFLPFANPLERIAPNPFSITSFDALSEQNATITQNADGSFNYNPANAGGAIAALGPGQSLVDRFSYTITDSNGQTSTAVVIVTVSGDKVVVTPTSGLVTSEAGVAASFDIVLSVPPASDVTINLTSDNPTEGVPTVSSLVFTPSNWNVPQSVTVVGQDDFFVDGTVAYKILTAATSSDPSFNNVAVSDVSLSNTDNDIAAVLVSPSSGLVTDERGGNATFTVVLSASPSAPVTIGLSISDSSEGVVDQASVTFNSTNWNVPQTVTVTGVDDSIIDGNVAYSVVTAAAVSDDLNFAGVNGTDVSLINRDFDFTARTSDGVTQYGVGQAGVGIDGRFDINGTNVFLQNGTLTVSVTQNGSSNDRIEIRNEGTSAGQVGISGSEVTFGGVMIGSFTGGVGAPLIVTFNATANRAALLAVARAVTYRDIGTNSVGTRSLSFAVVDGDGVAAAAVNKTVRVGLKRVLELQQNVDRGFGIYTGAKDVALSQSNPTTPFPIGANATEGLLVDWPDAGVNNKSQVLLRFEDLVGNALGQVPSDAIITSASLFVFTNNTGDGALLHRMLQPWSDSTATWNSFGEGVDVDDFEATDVPESVWGTLDVSGATGVGFTGVSVTKDVRAWKSGLNNFGWLMEPHIGGTDGWAFSPAEASAADQRPLLRIEWVPAGTQSVVFQQDLNGYTGTQDTQISSNLISSQAESLTIGTDFEDASTSRLQSLLRFNEIIGNSAGQIPTGAIIHDAILTLATIGNNGMGDGGSFHRMGVDWSEDALWTTFTDGIQADGGEASADISFQAGLPELFPDAQAGLVDFEVVRDVQAWANGTPNFGWVALPWTGGTNGWFFYSSENNSSQEFTPKPKLEVFFTVPTNQDPTLTVANQSVSGNEGSSITNTGTWADPNASDVVTLTASVGTVTKNADGTWNWTIDGMDDVSNANVTITANDDQGGTASVSFTYTVNNLAPQLTVASSTVSGPVQTTLTNSGTWSDVSSDTVTLTSSLGTVTKNADGTWTWSLLATAAINNQTVTITGTDEDGGSSSVSFTITAIESVVVNSYVMHGGGTFTGDNRIDTGKSLAKEGTTAQTLTFNNLINTTRGINLVSFEVKDLAGTVTAADFAFQMSPQGVFAESTNPPSGWGAAPAPTSVTVTPSGSNSRITITWPNNVIENRWLRLSMLANANTGLASAQVYYLGHLRGEVTGVQSGQYIVNNTDAAAIAARVSGNNVPVTNIYDLDKNSRVLNADIGAMSPGIGVLRLRNITIPASTAGKFGAGNGDGGRSENNGTSDIGDSFWKGEGESRKGSLYSYDRFFMDFSSLDSLTLDDTDDVSRRRRRI